ncbi:MFS general substrate transporter [Guyanagaster necrorhizus]|uniref:MFS general substrate transporter n=1 Tax=Guyanagaster necrorhizus TaxID=856835 RepID=A0A9P8AP57_9AGAR|nr:MFS general substrate transporter [Guyanagaster necrorhizus MCA 3950]KAG7441532.1 MFS general substrate transporter [Guyanagaster necrorhizus MCA 3950]
MVESIMTPTPRSSVTALETTLRPHSPHIYSTSLEQEIAIDEHRIEKYGANDPQEPKPKNDTCSILDTTPLDPNMVTWADANDQLNPQNWSGKKKWAITALCILLALNVTFSSSAPTSATTDIIAAFDINTETAYALVTVFLLGYVVGPVLWGPGSELYGRRPVMIGTMTVYTLFHLGQALAQNIQTLMICRFFGGFFAVGPLTVNGGIIADVWPALGRGPATSLFSASVFMGPVLGPLVGGFIATSPVSWRWVFWVMMIFAGACTILGIIFLPETYAPALLLKKAQTLRKDNPEKNAHLYAEHEKQDWSIRGVLHRTLYRPFQMLLMEPILVLVTIYLSVVYGVLYALFEAIPVIFVETRGFTIWQNGLIFIGVGIGASLGSLINHLCSRHYPELVPRWKGFPPPEERLYGAMVAGPCLVIGAFWLGWTGQYASIPWYVPAISTILIGAGINLIFMSFLSYLVDTYLMYAASAFAANTIIRSLVAAAFPLFTVQMYHNLGINWASTLVGLIALVLAPSPFLFYKYGSQIRSRSKFAPCIVSEAFFFPMCP